MATCNGVTITASELDVAAAQRLASVRMQEYRIRRAVLEELITNALLRQLADKKQLTVDSLLKAEVDDKVPTVATAKATLGIDQNPARFNKADRSDAVESTQDELRARRNAVRKEEFLRALRESADIDIQLDPPRSAVAEGGAPFKGPAGAPIKVIVFGDFQCPFCARLAPVLDEIQKEFPNEVRIAFRHFPLEGHLDAPQAAAAAVCAREQGRFWEMYTLLFADQRRIGSEYSRRNAEQIGLDVPMFETCLKLPKTTMVWESDRREGQKYGVTGTPTLFVNGRMLAGLPSPDILVQVIEEELHRESNTARAPVTK